MMNFQAVFNDSLALDTWRKLGHADSATHRTPTCPSRFLALQKLITPKPFKNIVIGSNANSTILTTSPTTRDSVGKNSFCAGQLQMRDGRQTRTKMVPRNSPR